MDFEDIPISDLHCFLKSDFNNFNKKGDKKVLEKIIQEIKSEKETETLKIPFNNYEAIGNARKVKRDKYQNNKNIVMLDLTFEENNNNENEDEVSNKSKQQIKIPPGVFPNLKV